MLAIDFNVGKKLINKETKRIVEIQEIDGNKLWVELEWGDIFDWVDENLYDELN